MSQQFMWILQFLFRYLNKNLNRGYLQILKAIVTWLSLYLTRITKSVIKQLTRPIILFFISSLVFFTPLSFAQNSPSSPAPNFSNGFASTSEPVVVDGIPLFDLQAVDRFTAKDRADFANKMISEAIANSQNINFDVNNDPNTGVTYISLNDQYLLTVTANDVLPNFSPLEQATQWQKILRTATAKAKKERTRQYLWQRSVWIMMAIAALIGLQILLGILTQKFKLKT
ncbi:hypothetical protein IQ219_14020, partial [Synechocystis sp. LEGE 06083]|nr:hypothetical protein [Synechocystis sp. LEGE 06083]